MVMHFCYLFYVFTTYKTLNVFLSDNIYMLQYCIIGKIRTDVLENYFGKCEPKKRNH